MISCPVCRTAACKVAIAATVCTCLCRRLHMESYDVTLWQWTECTYSFGDLILDTKGGLHLKGRPVPRKERDRIVVEEIKRMIVESVLSD